MLSVESISCEALMCENNSAEDNKKAEVFLVQLERLSSFAKMAIVICFFLYFFKLRIPRLQYKLCKSECKSKALSMLVSCC